jgi:hypothetical protein
MSSSWPFFVQLQTCSAQLIFLIIRFKASSQRGSKLKFY